eukprot:6204437-Pleurochrysis_carterae.AAC.1
MDERRAGVERRVELGASGARLALQARTVVGQADAGGEQRELKEVVSKMELGIMPRSLAAGIKSRTRDGYRSALCVAQAVCSRRVHTDAHAAGRAFSRRVYSGDGSCLGAIRRRGLLGSNQTTKLLSEVLAVRGAELLDGDEHGDSVSAASA